jgi:SAM-dependent methyltransferase
MGVTSQADARSIPVFCYREWRKPFDPRWRFLTGLINPQRILDVGCGPGGTLDHVRRMYPGVGLHGVDILDRTLPGVDFHRIDLDHDPLPFPDGFFDVVICTHVLEHLHYSARASAEIGRVLRTGGALYIETPSVRATLVPFGLSNFWDDPTHVRPFTRNSFNSLLVEYAKLKPIRIGLRRSWPHVFASVLNIPLAIIRLDKTRIIDELKNIYGWAIFGIGLKLDSDSEVTDEEMHR